MSDDKIVHITGADIPATADAIREEVLAGMEQVMEKVRAGEIVAVAFIAVNPNHAVQTGWIAPGRQKLAHKLLAGTIMLQHDLIAEFK